MRLFFAVEPTAPLRAVLAARCRALRRLPAGAGLRWIDPASYHMTLAFLGQVPPQRVAMLLAAARRGLQQAPVSAAVLGGLAWLPRPSLLGKMTLTEFAQSFCSGSFSLVSMSAM